MTYNSPPDILQLLDNVVAAARRTTFYGDRLPRMGPVTSLEDFKRVPVTPIGEFRAQRLADLVPEPSRVQWIAGPYKGQNPRQVAVAEGNDETGRRYDLFRDALRDSFPHSTAGLGAVVTSPERRYFAAEVSTILGYVRIPTHVFIDHGSRRVHELLGRVGPHLLVILSESIVESDVPSVVELCITFRRSHRLDQRRQLDLYLVDELGFLGHSTDLARWVLYNDQYYFERSEEGRLIVTSLRNRTQPLLRLETRDEALVLEKHHAALGHLSPSG